MASSKFTAHLLRLPRMHKDTPPTSQNLVKVLGKDGPGTSTDALMTIALLVSVTILISDCKQHFSFHYQFPSAIKRKQCSLLQFTDLRFINATWPSGEGSTNLICRLNSEDKTAADRMNQRGIKWQNEQAKERERLLEGRTEIGAPTQSCSDTN